MTSTAADADESSSIEHVQEALDSLKQSSRFSMAIMALGLAATLSSAAFSVNYLFGTYSDLSKAKAELDQTATRAVAAQASLESVRSVLGEAQATTHQGSRLRIEQALERLTAGEANLRDISLSVNQASRLLPVEASPARAIPGERWFVVVESYATTQDGERLARLRMEQINASGECAQLWKTISTGKISVTLGGPIDQKNAVTLAKTSQQKALTSAAYARLDINRNWQFIAQSSYCSGGSMDV